jgi:hypothetical protein
MYLEKLAALLVTAFTVLLYLMGWVYLYYYFASFKVDVYEISPSLQYVLVSSFIPILYYAQSIWLWLVLGLIVVGVCVIGQPIANAIREARGNVQFVIGLIVVLVIVGIAFRVAKHVALVKADKRWREGDIVHFDLGDIDHHVDCGQVPCVGENTVVFLNRVFDLRYLISTDKFHYAYAIYDGGRFILKLPLSDVKSVLLIGP